MGKEVFSLGDLEHAARDHPDYIDDELKLFAFVGAWEEGEACEELDHDTAHAPHVDGLGVGEHAEHDLGSAVEPTLDICVHNLLI